MKFIRKHIKTNNTNRPLKDNNLFEKVSKLSLDTYDLKMFLKT